MLKKRGNSDGEGGLRLWSSEGVTHILEFLQVSGGGGGGEGVKMEAVCNWVWIFSGIAKFSLVVKFSTTQSND